MTNSRTIQYDQYKDMPIEELAQSICSGYAAGSEHELKKLIYEHKINLVLLDKQAEIIKSSNRIIAIATISAALLGAIVGAVLQYKLTQKTEVATPQIKVPLISSLPPK